MTAQHPLLSIVTVTLNPGDALGRTIRSVAEQTFTDHEHVVKDGGSTDGSLLAARGGRNVRIVERPDGGIYDAMNQALEACRGDYVLFLNAGDLFAGADSLAEVARALRSAPPPDLVVCDHLTGEFGDAVVGAGRLSRFMVYRTTICHQACFFRRDCFTRLGPFDTSLRIAADHEFLARAVLKGRVRTVHVPVAVIRYEGGGFSRRAENRERHLRELAEIRRRHFPPATRVLYAFALTCTLPPLRRAIFERRALRALRRPYLAVVNTLNRGGQQHRT
jgi:glycosyltransferase involved in cell wall biosynthesis